MNNGYKINFTTGTVTMTKAFSLKAAMHGTEEYNTIVDLRDDFPHFKFITRTPPKRKCSNRLTYTNMLTFIECQKNADILLKAFAQASKVCKGQGGNAYQNTKKWFLATFPNYKETPRFDDKGNMINDFTRKPEDTIGQLSPMQKSA